MGGACEACGRRDEKKAKIMVSYTPWLHKGGGNVFFFPPEDDKIDSNDIYSKKKKELVPHDRKMR